MKKIGRREFIQQTSIGALSLGTSVIGLGTFEAEAKTVKARVVVVRGSDPYKMLSAALKVFGGMAAFVKGKRVVLKPNMAFKNPANWGNNTSPEAAAAVAKLCHEGGASRIVAVDHTMATGGKSITACGVAPALEKVSGVKALAINRRVDFVKKAVPHGKQLKETDLAKTLLDSDLLINIPVAKQHAATKVSFGLKNLMGLVWDRRYFHQAISLHQGIADLATLVKPALTVIDATRVMVSNGPQGPGKVQTLNTLVISTDPVAADAVALGLTQWNNQKLAPSDVEHIKAAALLGLGVDDLKRIKVVKKRV